MPKIAHFLSFGIGGADRAALELVRCLIRRGLDITILYNQMSFPRRTADQDDNQPLLSIFDEARALAPQICISSAAEIEDLGFDIVHTHRSGEDEWLLPGLGLYPRTYKIIETNFHGATETTADFRIYPSLSLVKSKRIVNKTDWRVIPNVVNSIQGIDQRDRFAIDDDTLVFGRIGRSDKSIYSSKLIEEYAKIETSGTLLIWVGKSKLAKSDAARFGAKNVLWLDPIENPKALADIYETFDVFLHVNALGETFGNTVAEAVLRGIPVASLRGKRGYPQAQAELLVEGQYCTTKRKFRKILSRYKREPEFRMELSEINRTFGRSHLGGEKISAEVAKVYQEVLT
jgi:glycosyltransferase involved in cell wall biosynthesis